MHIGRGVGLAFLVVKNISHITADGLSPKVLNVLLSVGVQPHTTR